MAVNTAALKTFAPAMRRQLLEAVGRKLDLLAASGQRRLIALLCPELGE